MSFKETLLKKIQIDTLAEKVISSWGAPGSGKRIDKDAMRDLLEMSQYACQKKRDLDLYVTPGEGEKQKILVLDNELPIYMTTVEDVVIRKSPYVKEMLSIRNVIKILKDSDVKISIKNESVKTVQKECIDQLDLSYDAADIDEIAKDGVSSLENKYSEGVTESLTLLAELLGYQPPPKGFKIRHCEVFGAMAEGRAGEIKYGPSVIFSRIDNSLMLIEEQISSYDKEKINNFREVAAGNQKAEMEGPDVFRHLKDTIMKADSS
ncbi:MAG: hypothetical protein JRF72_02425 [Deltaproteobacteria bacterium]|nr:hypothetical protein [Deltaproteobacteria bacterium]